MKKNIELLIKILEKSKINSLEVSSFWGFRKIKLLQNSTNLNKPDSQPSNAQEIPVDLRPDSLNLNIDKTSSLKEGSMPSKSTSEDINTETIEAPLVGTIYLSPKPGEADFVSENQIIKKGQVICIIEAMKIFNEIESDKDGVVRKILVKNEDPIEFGQAILEIESQ